MKKYREYTPNDWDSYKQVHHKDFQEGTKYKVLQAMANAGKDGIVRRELMKVIWANQGFDPAKFVYRKGNSSQLFTDIQWQGLATSNGKGVYTITDGGRDYLRCTNRREAGRLLNYLRAMRMVDRLQEDRRKAWENSRELNRLRRLLNDISQITADAVEDWYPCVRDKRHTNKRIITEY